MPRNFSELKSGGTIPMLSPHVDKWGTRPPVPHRSTPVLKPYLQLKDELLAEDGLIFTGDSLVIPVCCERE